jgi:2'-hydroxyisoflavone reductase
MRTLILGGTAFLGIALREALAQQGHEVTLFNRGITQPAAVPGVRAVTGDRTRDLTALAGDRFDAVIDTSGYVPHAVDRSARFFASRTGRYVFVSSVSVFDISAAEIDESSAMPGLPEPSSRTVMTGETYGPLKAMCERIVSSTFRQRATIVRPGLIAGPHDRTDRFTYWPVRLARGGNVLAPGEPGAGVQVVDVRDLAEFVVHLIDRDAGSDYNVTSPQGKFTMGDVISACASVNRVPHHAVWVEDAFLTAHEVAPWTDLPLWIPSSLGIPGLLNVNVRKALVAGLKIRPLAQTVRDTLAWARTRPRGHTPRAGLTPQREAALLEEWHATVP